LPSGPVLAVLQPGATDRFHRALEGETTWLDSGQGRISAALQEYGVY
jgi:hypothetical protein